MRLLVSRIRLSAGMTRSRPLIEVRHSVSPSSVETATSAELRESFLVEDLFRPGEVHGVYTHDDRLVVGGAVPAVARFL